MRRNATPSPGASWLAIAALTALVAVRVTLPLAALAASGTKLPDLPRYDYAATTGDGSGFYAATREFLASWGRLPLAGLIGLAVAAVIVAAVLLRAWCSRRAPRAWLLVATAAAFALVVTPAVTEMNPPGAAVFGWPLVWSLPMLPYRALGFPLDPDIAFGFGLALSLLANAVSVVATAAAGLYATGRRSVALLAAGLFAFWPLLTGAVVGARAWQNGTWTVDTGLAMYGEPVSTALVTTALALLLRPRLTAATLAAAGVALSLATTVKLTNAIAAVLALALLAARFGIRRSLPFLGGALSFAPVVIAYWPKGYSAQFDNPQSWPRHPFSAAYVVRSWSESLLFGPRMLAVLMPLAALGVVVLRWWWPRLLLAGWILGNAAVYSFYRVTPLHPRFLFASLPAVLVLWSLGAVAAAAAAWRVLAPRVRTLVRT
jgi:hypothetical protein